MAEALGTFLLVLVGCGAIVANATQPLGHLGVSLAWGAIVAIVIATTGHIGGAHINPAVTVSLAAAGHFPWRRVGPYVVAQCLGAVLGAYTLRAAFGTTAFVGATIPSVGTATLYGMEILATAFLVFVITAVATDPKVRFPAPLAVGGAVFLCALVIGGFTGASMNPARSLGPAVAAGLPWTSVVPYTLAPVIGGLLGAAGFGAMRSRAHRHRDAIEAVRTAVEDA